MFSCSAISANGCIDSGVLPHGRTEGNTRFQGVLIENSEVELAAFALLFEFDGDQKHIRHVLYNCSASRPGIEGKTNEDSKEVQTEKLSLKAVPLANGMVKAKTGNTTDATTYADWCKAVYVPAAESDAATQSAAKPAKAVKE